MRATYAFFAFVAIAAGLLAACGAATVVDRPATDGLRSYVEALRSDDPRAAWDMLAKTVRDETSFEEFQAQWQQSRTEREQQAERLESLLERDSDLGERSAVRYDDGKSAFLRREDGQWRIDTGILSRTVAGEPRDAVALFSRALKERSFERVLAVLTRQRREAISREVARFAESLERNRAKVAVQRTSPDRAVMRWEDDGTLYRITLARENGEWRIDDFDILPVEPPE